MFRISKLLEVPKSCTIGPMSTAASPRERIPHPSVDALAHATILRTLGDPLRLDLVKLLADGREYPCGELADKLGLPASTGSYHTRLMREAGITRTRAMGTTRYISLRRDDLEARFPGLENVLLAS